MATSDAVDDGYHSAFNDLSADVVLCTPDHAKLRVHSVMLKLASGWFRTMFTLPQNAAHGSSEIVLDVDEPSGVLVALLTMISGAGLPSLESIDRVEDILNAAEKYDMPGPISIIRKLITLPPLISTPLRVYGIACRWEWVEEAKTASTHTLTMDMCAADHLHDLSRMQSRDLAALMLLHRRRRDGLIAGLTSADKFTANNPPGPCRTCQKTVDHGSWNTLKNAWIQRAESHPLGESLTVDDILDRNVVDVLSAACAGCSTPYYVKAETLQRLQTLIADLPKSVEGCFQNIH